MKQSRVIVDRLGPEDAAKLSQVSGGTRLNVPANIGPPASGGRNGYQRLSKILGERLAVKLIVHFGGRRIYVPRPECSSPVDVRTIARLTKRGLSASAIARKLGCSDRTVHEKRAIARQRGLIPSKPEGNHHG